MSTDIIEFVSTPELVSDKPVVNQSDIETLKYVLRESVPFTRKPSNWGDVSAADYTTINNFIQANLSIDLSILPTYPQDFVYGDGWGDSTPDDDISDQFRNEMIFTIQMNNGRLFLINTEGFGYCRYVFELTNPPIIKSIN